MYVKITYFPLCAANFKLPHVGESFDDVQFIELEEADAQTLVAEYNKEGQAHRSVSGSNNSNSSFGSDRNNDRSNDRNSGGRTNNWRNNDRGNDRGGEWILWFVFIFVGKEIRKYLDLLLSPEPASSKGVCN